MLSTILQAALGTGVGLDGTSFADLDWQQLETALARHGLTAVGYEVLERHGVEIPPETRERMHLQARLVPYRRRLLAELLDDVAAAFAAAQTPAVLLEGAGLLRLLNSGEGYPIPEAVEMLVAEDDLPLAARQLCASGFHRGDRTGNSHRASFLRGPRGSVPLVLRSRPFDSPQGLLGAGAIRAGARAADQLPGVLRTMSPEHELIYLCLLVDAASNPMQGGPAPAEQRRGRSTATPISWHELYGLAVYLQDAGEQTDWAQFVVEAGGRGVAGQVACALRLCQQTCLLGLPPGVLQGLSGDSVILSAGLLAPTRSVGGASSRLRRNAMRGPVPVPYVAAESLVDPDRRPGLRIEYSGEDRITVSNPSVASGTEVPPVAAAVLEWCDGKHSVESIAEIAACIFGDDPRHAAAEVRQWIETFSERGWLRAKGASIKDHRPCFPIVNQHGRWADRLSNRYCTSRYIDWRSLRRPEEQSGVDEVLSFTQFDLEDAHLYRARRKVAWMREPRPIAWWTYDALEHHIPEIDTVLTYETELIEKYPGKCIYCPGGGSHIDPADFRIHPKSKLVSFIASAKRFRAPGHLARHELWELIRPGRPALTRQMLNGLEVDCYGALVGKPIDDKLESLQDYMFQIAIENVIWDTYFTEKLIDCFLTGTIPIYRGSRRAAEFFDADGILFYSSTEELFAILRRLTPDDYERRLPHVHRNFELAQRYTHAVDWVYEHTDIFRL